MWSHGRRFRAADVVAAFDSQDDADEAVMELRCAGFTDDRIGYFCSTPDGYAADLLERNYWLPGAAIGTVAGAALGALIAWAAAGRLDPWGLMVTYGVIGALFVGFVGGLIGLDTARSRVVAPVPSDEPFVLAVSAGDTRDLASAILRRHGGHDLLPGGAASPAHPSPLPS